MKSLLYQLVRWLGYACAYFLTFPLPPDTPLFLWNLTERGVQDLTDPHKPDADTVPDAKPDPTHTPANPPL